MRAIRTTATFRRSVKRLTARDKAALDDAVRTISEYPDRGTAKVGDLAGVRVFKFRMNRQQVLLAYEAPSGSNAHVLLALGSHENFYRDLKR
jgi:hypothetical protein